jgi:hypothetical protein
MRGLARPSAEVVKACLAPCVWVWGFWFGFVLRRVALLCGVVVRLHLALFPAGGPFLPSLSVTLYILARSCLALGRSGIGLFRAPRLRVWVLEPTHEAEPKTQIWVLGSASLCVALLCAVCERLTLVCFRLAGFFLRRSLKNIMTGLLSMH